LFEVVPVEPPPLPEGPYDALLITSANGVRFGAEILARFADQPIYVVGGTSAHAVHERRRDQVVVGGGDVASTIPLIVAAGYRHVLHICGEETRPYDPLGLIVTRHEVYRSDARDARLFAKRLATLPPSVFAVHSPAAGRRLNALLPLEARYHFLIAISEAAAKASGEGWRKVHVAEKPDDTALLRLASTLCKEVS
jgi:uroporphyrinogen-III synthase